MNLVQNVNKFTVQSFNDKSTKIRLPMLSLKVDIILYSIVDLNKIATSLELKHFPFNTQYQIV